MKTLLQASLLTVVAGLAGCNSYRGAAIEGRVVDDATQQPLKGVIVVIHWPLERGGFHPDIKGRLLVQETITDSAGRYSFPEWGPLRPDSGYLSDLAPFMAFFKRGYEPFAKYDDYQSRKPQPRTAGLHGKTIALRAFQGGIEEYTRTINFVGDLYPFSAGACDWESFPRMTAELARLGAECRALKGHSCGMPSQEALRGSNQQPCRDPEQFLGGNNNEKQMATHRPSPFLD